MTSKVRLSVLRATRGNLKGSLTRLATFTETITEDMSLDVIQLRIEKVDELWNRFKASQEKIFEFMDEDGYVDPEPEFEEFESKCLLVKSVLLSALRERNKCAIDVTQTIPVAAPQNTIEQLVNASQSQANDCLPKIHIEPFSGNYRDWPAFRDMFESSVHNKPNMSPIRKFQFLRSCLRGEASNLLTHIPMSDATYEQAWERLERRYNRPRYIINSFLETLAQLPTMHSSNVRALRKISDNADEVIRGLNALNSFERDPCIIFTLIGKVDPDTRQAWSADSVGMDYSTIEDFLTFLERRCEALESCKGAFREATKGKSVAVRSMHVSSTAHCQKCNASHALTYCPEFLALNIEAKRDLVKSKRLCFNCLRAGHNSSHCQSKFRCKICNSRHHSLVHLGRVETSNDSSAVPASVPSFSSELTSTSTSTQSNTIVSTHAVNFPHFRKQTLLPTAVGLRRKNARVPITGIGSTCAGKSRGLVSMIIGSCFDSVSIAVDTFILSSLTSALPTVSFDVKNWNHISNLNLADPFFNQTSPVDILLGADKVWDILKGDVLRGSRGHPIAQNTIFGWVLAGKLLSGTEYNIHTHHSIVDIDLSLQAFWTIEEVDPTLLVSKEDRGIEKHFIETHRRDILGKYVVRLPFKTKPHFGDTLKDAHSRLKAMESRFSKDTRLHQSYSKFLDEYLALGHMDRVPSSEISKPNVYYLPHHAVFKPDSPSTKLRVVFDGSVKDAYGNSLNDSLMIGPPIQRNLFSVCVRFRRHKYVFTADIIKMFRQIWVADEDVDYQRILWRKSPITLVEHLRLRTVTYGTSCAPYLSVRVLEQLARDYREDYPVASEIVLNDFYVDDVVSGGDSIPDIVFKKQRLVELLSKGGLELSKWQSNCAELLQEGHMQSDCVSMDEENVSWVKVLGLYWNSNCDCFSFRFNLSPQESNNKREILRDIARIFDPLGFLAPSVVQLKILLQELWHQKLNWDDLLPNSIAAQWSNSRQQLHMLTQINIPRSIGFPLSNESFQLHGFSDASVSAYAAVIYSRYVLPNGHIETNIVAAKTRVAPIKQLTIPRLELCGALLLTRLLVAVQKSLNMTCSNVFAWCDSQVVLSWLSSPSRRWDIFVGNRTAEILNTIPRSRWFYVRSDQNPADCASRGIAPSVLIKHPIWWTGTHWLRQNDMT